MFKNKVYHFFSEHNVYVFVCQGSITAVELLLLNGAKVDIRDNNGQGPLHHATQLGHTGYALLFTYTQLNSTENYGRRCLTPLSPHRNYILS